MEQQPTGRQPGDQPTPELEESPEAVLIREGIAEALRDGGTIDDETAGVIARAITPGKWCAAPAGCHRRDYPGDRR